MGLIWIACSCPKANLCDTWWWFSSLQTFKRWAHYLEHGLKSNGCCLI